MSSTDVGVLFWAIVLLIRMVVGKDECHLPTTGPRKFLWRREKFDAIFPPRSLYIGISISTNSAKVPHFRPPFLRRENLFSGPRDNVQSPIDSRHESIDEFGNENNEETTKMARWPQAHWLWELEGVSIVGWRYMLWWVWYLCCVVSGGDSL